MNQNFRATQEIIQQLSTNQGGRPEGPPLPIELASQVEPQVAEVTKNAYPSPVPIQLGFYALKKFIKNGAKVCNGTTKFDKAEVMTLIILKTLGPWRYQRSTG